MPEEWQIKFVDLLEELNESIDWRLENGTCYQVILKKQVEKYSEEEEAWILEWGNEIEDPLADYQRGRRQLPVRPDCYAKGLKRKLEDTDFFDE